MRPLRQLEKYWKESELYTWEDTTDVSEFVKILASAEKMDMPVADLWSYSFLHALHPQTDLRGSAEVAILITPVWCLGLVPLV